MPEMPCPRAATCTAALLAIASLLLAALSVQAQPPLSTPAQRGAATVESRVLSQASAAGSREIRCRGKQGGFTIHSAGPKEGAPGMVKMAISYSKSRTPPGPDGTGLEPGTCAWADGLMASGDLSQVQFVTEANAQLKRQQHGSGTDASGTAAEKFPDAQTIPAYLNDANHYWSFSIEGKEYGWYLAGRHGPWKPSLKDRVVTQAAGGVSPSRPGSVTDQVVGPKIDATRTRTDLFALQNVRVFPNIGGVVVRFDARHQATPTVELHTEAPIKEPSTGRWFFPKVLASMKASPVASQSTGRLGHYLAQNMQLEQGKAFHYLITVPGNSSIPEYQHTGTFTTLGMTVKVVFSQVHVIDDSDSDGAGELSFYYYAHSERYQAHSPERTLASGAKFRPGVTLTIANQPIDRLKILVEGYEDDSGPGGRRLYPGVVEGQFDYHYAIHKPGVSNFGDFEWNLAKQELDLNRHPGKSTSIPFTIRSMPVAGKQARLMFEVSGYVEVTRPDR